MKQKLIDTLNTIFKSVPIYTEDIVKFYGADDEELLTELEESVPAVNIIHHEEENKWGMSILTLLKTILDIAMEDDVKFEKDSMGRITGIKVKADL